MLKTHVIFIFLLFFGTLLSQESNSGFIETQATITSIESNQSGRRTSTMAKVDYVTQTGDTLSSQVQLIGLPILGSFKKEGDVITVLYDKNNPYLIQSANESFLQSYGLYILIALGILIFLFRFLKRKKTA